MMAVATYLDIMTQDAQKEKATLTFRINPATFGATTLPTAAKIEAVINAVFGNTKFSTNIVTAYAVRVEEEAPVALGGTGGSPSSQAMRVRNEIGTKNWMFSVPGLVKSNVTWDPVNPNSISTSDALFTALRAALVDAAIAFGDPANYAATPTDEAAQTATGYDGRRTPPRPR